MPNVSLLRAGSDAEAARYSSGAGRGQSPRDRSRSGRDPLDVDFESHPVAPAGAVRPGAVVRSRP